MQELALKLRATENRFEARTGRVPTAAELADALNVSLEDLLEARVASGVQYANSLDHPVRSSESDGLTIAGTFAVEDGNLDAVEDAVTLERLQDCLDDREREILRLRFTEDLHQSEIADIIGCSQMHVSRLLRGALARLASEARRHDASSGKAIVAA